jgi:hypothetical protein
VADFFSAETLRKKVGDRKASVITSISMFYDLEEPVEFAKQVASSLAEDGVWVFEQSYLPLMLERNSYDTVCHEHLEYYALAQILFILKKAGLKAIDIGFNDINGGSFSVMATPEGSPRRECSERIAEILAEEEKLGISDGSAWISFRQRIDAERDALLDFLKTEKSAGHLVMGYGASTKGNVLLQYCGLTPELLPFIAEVNPDKFGAFTPGTKIPIISEADALARKPSAYMVLPWHFRDNLLEREKAFMEAGGRMVFPLPTLSVVSSPARGEGKATSG